MPHGIDLNLVPVFNTLMEERNVTRAGARLNRTQSAVSNALKRLRETFKDPLFVRSVGGLDPTPKALLLYDTTTRIAQLADLCVRLERDFDPATDSAHFTIGAPDRLSLPVILPFLKKTGAAAPNVRFDLRTADRGHAVDLILSRSLDLAIGSFDDLPADVSASPAFSEELVCLCGPDHVLASAPEPLALEVLLGHPHLVVTSGGVQGATFDRLLTEAGLQRSAGVTLSNFSLVPEMLAGSNMIGVFTKRVARTLAERAGLRIRRISPELPPIDHSLIWHHSNDEDGAHLWLRHQLRSICAA